LDERYRGQQDREYDLDHRAGMSGDVSGRGLTIALAVVLAVFIALVLALLIR
jgi:hypothetical protein